jgi:hypothetical protein
MILAVFHTSCGRLYKISASKANPHGRYRHRLEQYIETNGWVTLETGGGSTKLDGVDILVDHLERVYNKQVTKVYPYNALSPGTEESIRQAFDLRDHVSIDVSDIEHPEDIEVDA